MELFNSESLVAKRMGDNLNIEKEINDPSTALRVTK